ncbi:Uncharacterized protein APZ42_023730 [Daphnia magna]|uniref:Uncharacterized protein n=1 Tax=Daphnia magna TaxID=35525 RepID=A0A164UQS5_9CRUS|nr:Uncharacterized protein APZ42_023730 [Daphnia magna]
MGSRCDASVRKRERQDGNPTNKTKIRKVCVLNAKKGGTSNWKRKEKNLVHCLLVAGRRVQRTLELKPLTTADDGALCPTNGSRI